MKLIFAKKNLFAYVLLFSYIGLAQEFNTFDIRYQNNIKGDLTFIANNIVNRDGGTATTEPEDPYNATGNSSTYNDWLNMQYIDVDSDPTTFSSSTATFNFPQANCNLIRYAGLYWSATYPSAQAGQAIGTGRQNDFNQVRLRVPGGAYIDVTADEILFDGFTSTDPSVQQNSPYACYADVTALITPLADPSGDYTIANVRSIVGSLSPGGGAAAGWTLVIVYENPTLSGKLITTFDGFARVRSANPIVDITYSGFNTIPVGPVRANIGAAALEGDNRITGDRMRIRAASNGSFTTISNAVNPASNFFNSNITLNGVITNNRTPNSINTLGYDTDMFLLNNPLNSVIPNAETAATFRFTSSGDQYYPFFNSFNVEIIEPNIVVEKRVEDIAGNDITGAGVNLGQQIDYVLTFQNTGNDDATNYTIRDVLPINVTFIPTNLVLPPGVTYVYDSVAHEITFSVPPNLIEEGDPPSQIRLRVRVAENCFDFIDACTDLIQNLAFSTYEGVINDNQITDDPSVSDFDNCGFITPGATNFLLDDLENCDFSRTVQLCGDDVLLDAGDNFDDYIWYKDENGDNLIDPGDTVLNDGNPDNDLSTQLVNEVGVYIVDKIVADPCKGFQEIITVELFGATQTNPIVDLINDPTNTVEGEVVTCPNDGDLLPKIFLCGLNDTELVQINIPDAQSIVWEQLDEASCTASVADCANKDSGCTWNNVGTGNNFLAANAGQYRLVINYQNGCFSRFYFNIFKNPLDPQYNSRDLICTTPGNITVTNMPADYEYQLLDAISGAVLVPYSSNNGPSFTIASNGAYTVEMRQQGVVGGCIFMLEDIGILTRNFQVDITTRDTDCNGLGEISISALNVEPQYYYEISQGGTTVDTFGPSVDNNYTFQNLNDGTYDVLVTTDDGCTYTEQVVINDVTNLAVNAVTTKPIDCTDGIITVTGSGGFPNPDYLYAIWSYNGVDLYATIGDIPAGAFQDTNDFSFTVAEAGDYVFVVVDANNCSALSNTATITIAPAVEYTTTVVDENCLGAADGSFAVNVTNYNGYSVSYTLTYPDTSTATNTSGSFTGLGQGNYSVTLTQTNGADTCDFVEIFTISGPANPLTGAAVIIQDYTCLQNGIIEAQGVLGGTSPYEYSIDGVNFVSGAGAETFSNLTDGTYTITIRDANSCVFVTNAITLDPLNEPSDLTFTATAPNCPAQISDVTVTVVDGNTPFLFEIIAPVAIPPTIVSGSSANFDGLAPDTYTFRVTDNKGCTYEESYTITPVAPINVVGQLVSNITCFGDTDGEVLFTVSDFATSYDYTITGPSNFNGTGETSTTIPLINLAAGSYNITVTDTGTNCTDTTTVIVEAPAAALALVAAETQPTCTDPGSVVLTASNGWGGYNYSLTYPDTITIVNNTTGDFTGLGQTGTYTASVTDVNGCIITTTFDLNASVAPVLDIVPNDICYDNATGLTLTANVTSGGDGNFEYRINGGIYDANNVFSGLGPGTYIIDVIDGSNCTGTNTITINPELSVTATANAITACGTTTDVTITAAGGDGNFVYAIVADGIIPTSGDFSITNPITITGAGDYDVYVRDNNGVVDFCETFYDITIVQDAPLGIAISNTPILCSGEAQATITITPSGGEAPYEYSIDNGANYQPSNTFVNRAAGSYTIRVRDNNGCDISQIYTISEPFTLSASAGVTELVECNPTIGAEVRITNAQGGTTPYEYSFDGGNSYGASAISFLLPGTHTVYIRDANNCIFPMTVTVDPEPTPPNLTTSISYECDGEGTVTVTPDSPAFDYTYEINGTPNTPDTSNIFNNVPVGNHTITVNYISNTSPPPSNLLLENFGTGPNTSIPEVDPAYCYEPQDGSVRPCEPGSPGPINDGEYSVTQVITNPFGSWLSPNDHSGLPNGRFLAMNVGGVVGPNGIIYAKRNIEVLPNRDITISLWAFNLLRNGTSGADPDINIQLVDGGGTVIANTTTGNVPKNNGPNDWQNYTVTLNPGANTNLDIVIRTNSAVTGGNDIAIDDIEAFQIPQVCSSSVTVDVIVEDGYAFDATIINFSDLACNGDTSGFITFEVENFDTVNGFEYSVNGGAFSAPQTSSPITVSGLSAGNATIVVRDVLDNSCSTTLVQNIAEPVVLVASAAITDAFTCSNTGAIITASATGGTPTYQYQLEDNIGGIITAYQTGTTFTDIPAGDYIIRVRDINACEDPIDVVITVVAPDTVVFTTTSTACYTGNSDGIIQVDVTAGNGEYQFSINSGPWMTPIPSSATTYTFNNLSAGIYTIDVKDQFGCVGLQQNVTINPQITASAVLTTDLTCVATASVAVNANGGSGTYSYEWSNDAGANYFTTNFTGSVFGTATAATYIFRVTDTTAPTACTIVTNAVVISPADTPVITTVTPTHILCNGDSTGVLDIVIDTSVGNPPYVIEVIETISTTNYGTQTTGLPAGDYEVRITDDKGCVSAPFAVTINQPNAITYDINLIPITCNPATGTDPGSITVENLAGGTAEYTYYLTGNNGYSDSYLTTAGGEDHTFAILEFGIYEVDVVDANGCSVRTTNIIASPPNDLDIDVSTLTASCAAGGTAIVTVSSVVGSGNYEFGILDTYSIPYSSAYQAPDVPGGDTATFTGLVPGITYTFVVHDLTTNCYYFETAATPIDSPSNMTVTSLVEANITCTGAADGNVTFTFDNYDVGATQIDYEIFNAQSNLTTGFTGSATVNPPIGAITISNFATLPQGVYYILLNEINGAFAGCSISSPDFTITESTNLLNVTAASPTNDNCNLNAGVITATAQFGTAPYEFQYLLSTAPAPTAASPGWVSTTTTNVESGNYIVYVKDANDCIQSDAVTVVLDVRPEISLAVVDECAAEGTFEVLVTLDVPGSAPHQISVNGGPFQNITFNASNQYTVSGLSSGAGQTIAVRGVNGCPDTDPFTIQPNLQFNATLTTLLDCEVAPANNAEITIDVSIGSGNYDYEITGPVGQIRTALPSNPFVWNLASAPGAYTITVYDTSTAIPNCSGSIVVNVPATVTPLFIETHTDISCNSANDGVITLTQTDNGINPLTYSISPIAGSFNVATNSFENLPPNTYTVTATGTNNCTTDIAGILISEPNVIVVPAPTVVEFGCTSGNNPNNATITVDDTAIAGGSGNYVIYEFINDQGTLAPGDDIVVQSGSNTTYIETNVAGGSYTINVYDDNGCLGSTNTIILPYDELLTATGAITNPISCNPGTDGEITIAVTSTNNDTTRFEYSIDNGGSYQVSNVFSGLDVGTYNFLIRHIDTGCIITTSETITDPNTFTIDAVKLSNVICFGTATGEVTFELLDVTYAGGFDWEIWDTNGTPTNLADDISVTSGTEATNGPTAVINVASGSYYVAISQINNPNCVNTEAFTIDGPSASITANIEVTPLTCVGNDGIIEITDVLGGWGGYSYYVGTLAPTGVGDYVSGPRFENLSVGTYEAWVIDVNGCQQIVQNNIILADPAAITATLQINQENCTNLQGEIEVIGTTGGQGNNYTYQLIKDSVAFGAPQTTTVFSGLGAGVYEVQITDQWSCTFTTTTETLYEEITLTGTVVKPIDCTVSPDGEITITANGGSANLDYTVTFPDLLTTISNATGVFTGLSQPGTYTFVVSDLDTTPNCTEQITVDLDAPTPITFDPHTVVDVSCNGLSDGSITVNLTPVTAGVNDNPIYTYNLYDGGVLIAGPQTSPIFTGLPAASYEVEVISDRGCFLREVVIVGEPTVLLVVAAATAFNCNPDNTVNTSTITANVSVGSGTIPYLYSIDNVNFQTSNIFEIIDNGVTQNITVYVTDGNSCLTTDTVTIEPLNVFTVVVTQNTAISCINQEEVLITVSDDGNPANVYTYELLPIGNPNGALTGNPTNTTATFDLTEVGSYTFRVTDTTTGCYVDTTPHNIAPYDLIDVVATATMPVICFGDTNGDLEIDVTGYTGAYTYEVFTGAGVTTGITGAGNTATNPLTINGLSGGNYFVRVTETAAPECVEDSNVITIVSPDTPMMATVNPIANVTCTNDQGELLVSASGGYAPYDIVLTNTTTGQVYNAIDVTSQIFTGLSAGNFTVTVTDDGGCVVNDTETLVLPALITANITATPTSLVCYGDTNATVTAINVLGGEGTYQYQLNYYDATGTVIDFSSGGQISPIFDNLGAGIYSITVSDSWSCDVETIQVTISEPTEVSSSLIQLTPLSCTNPAEIELIASGGTGPYEWSDDAASYIPMSGGNTHVFTISDGVYQYYVRDSFGCEATISNQVSVDIVLPLTIVIDNSAAIVNCTGEATATIIADVTGGLGNYSYELFTDAALTNLIAGPQVNEEFNSLIAGSYYVRVTSMDCVEVSNEIVIQEPTPLQIDRQEFTDVTCAGQNDGTITVEVSGGTGDIFYAITPNLNQFDTENVFTGLEPGVYDVIAQDENGCFILFQFTIIEPTPIDVTFTALPEVCAGSEDGSITVNITGGTAPYQTAFNSNNDADFIQDQTSFVDLAAGTYVVFIRDAQDCETNIIVEIEPGVNLNAIITPVYECSGDTPDNYINITMEDPSVLGSIMYALDSTDPADMQLNPDFINMAPGTHYIAISHANGCVQTTDFEIENFEPLTLLLEQNNINEITAVSEGGKEAYTFYFDGVNNGEDNTYFITRTDTYTVTVVDDNGCEVSAQIFMEFIDIEIPNFFTPDGDGQNDFWTPRNTEGFPEILTIIFDRYGREVYRMRYGDQGWDGIYQNSDLPTGDYWYVIKLRGENDDREFVGHFTLYR